MEAPKAIIFDLDNTLHDRRKSFVVYCEKFVEDYSENLYNTSGEVISRMIREDRNGYRTEEDFFSSLLNKLNWREAPDLQELINHKLNLWPVEVIPMNGMVQLLSVVKERNLKVGLLTNGHGHTQRKKMQALNLTSYFDAVRISGEEGVAKPDHSFFDLILNDLQVSASECVMVGDHQDKDIAGGQRLGMTGVWITDGQLWDIPNMEPDYIVTELTQLTNLIKEWMG